MQIFILLVFLLSALLFLIKMRWVKSDLEDWGHGICVREEICVDLRPGYAETSRKTISFGGQVVGGEIFERI